MKFLLIGLALFGCSLADTAVEGPQRALLVLPQPVYNPSSGQQEESVEKLSEKVSERLGQEQGSQRGNYHVYLSDGRLQRVQFTAAPLRQQNNNNNNLQQSNSYSQQSSSNLESFQRQQESSQQQSNFGSFQGQQESSQQQSNLGSFERQQQQPSSDSYSQQQQGNSDSYSRVSYQGSGSQEPHPVIAHFGRLQQERTQQQLAQLRQEQEQLRQREQEVLQQLQQQKEFASNYVATIRYSEVPPIPAPIYSQGPAPLTRILRYAPVYY